MPEENTVQSFEMKLAALSKMERRTASSFKKLGIEEEFEWPVQSEVNFGLRRILVSCYGRKGRATATYSAVWL